VVQFQEVWVQNYLVTSCHFQASSHFCNQNTFNLQDWLTFIACWSLIKIFCQNKMLNICWFQNNKETQTRHVSLKDEMWSQNKNATFHKNMIDNSSPFLNQLFWWYLCFAKHFRSHVILKVFEGQYSQWQPPSQIPLVFCSPNSRLDSCNCSTEWPEIPPVIFKSPVWIISHRKQWLRGI